MLLPAATVEAQLGNPSSTGPPAGVPYQEYGSPEPADLSEIAYGGQRYHRTNVRTKGSLKMLASSPYFVLGDGTARLLVIPVPEIERDTRGLVGRRVEMTGVVRVLPRHQSIQRCYGQGLPESKCEDYELPVLPDARLDWPEVSITVMSMTDMEPSARKGSDSGALDQATLAASVGQTVRVVGLFAGKNLFGDLPAGSAPAATDWVLKLGRDAVWVTGKPPRGKGWQLDPSYTGDTSRWLEVTGRVEKRGEIVYLRASKVALTAAPRTEEPE